MTHPLVISHPYKRIIAIKLMPEMRGSITPLGYFAIRSGVRLSSERKKSAMNNKTIEFYDSNAADFAARTENADMSECRERFLSYLAPGGRILDAGCGSGRDMIAFRDAGFDVSGIDASAEICRIASEKTGISVRQVRFEELQGEAEYDGIWASASLLHVAREDLPDVLGRLHRLLKAGGFLYASFKYGTEDRVKDGRYFCDFTEESCRRLLEQADFAVREIFVSGDVREGRGDEMWVNAIASRG